MTSNRTGNPTGNLTGSSKLLTATIMTAFAFPVACSAEDPLRGEIAEQAGIEQTQKSDIEASNDEAPTSSADDESKHWLAEFYEEKELRPLWVNKRGGQDRLEKFLSVLDRASDYGFDREKYQYSPMKEKLSARDSEALATLELMASRNFVRFASDVRDGRVSPRMDFTDEELQGRILEEKEILLAFAKKGDPEKFISKIRRDNPIQKGLVQSLKHYEDLASNGGWETVSLKSDKLELGATGDEVTAIAARLRAEGFFKGDIATEKVTPANNEELETASKPDVVPVYDDRLAAAVETFQKSRGIEPDGIVGPNTLARMNEPAEMLVDQIRLNLERARWLPQDFSDRYVLVNIAGYSAGFYENETLKDKTKIVVGKYHQQTPVFSGSMSYAVINPYWNIPESIVREEIAPKMREDKNYLASKNMEVVDGWDEEPSVIDADKIDWDDLPTTLDFRVRQKPGPTNSLGHIKFMFPNEYNVYLHDSPAESLFNETKRAFSHGCIRLAEPLKVAEWVFASQPDYDDAEKVSAIIETRERTVVTLDTEIPVYISYFTAWRDENGDTFFYDDLYKRDDKLRDALERSYQRVATIDAAKAP